MSRTTREISECCKGGATRLRLFLSVFDAASHKKLGEKLTPSRRGRKAYTYLPIYMPQSE